MGFLHMDYTEKPKHQHSQHRRFSEVATFINIFFNCSEHSQAQKKKKSQGFELFL